MITVTLSEETMRSLKALKEELDQQHWAPQGQQIRLCARAVKSFTMNDLFRLLREAHEPPCQKM